MEANELISLSNFNLLATEHPHASAAYEFCNNQLHKNNTLHLVEVIPLLTGAYVTLLASNNEIPTSLETQFITDFLVLKKVQSQTMRTLYHLHTPAPTPAMAILEVPSFLSLVEILHLCNTCNIEVFDHKNTRGFLKNQIVVGSSIEKLKKFLDDHAAKLLHSKIIENPHPSLASLFSLSKPN